MTFEVNQKLLIPNLIVEEVILLPKENLYLTRPNTMKATKKRISQVYIPLVN
jgi:hypothetical protein